MSLFTKQKQIHRYRKQIYGSQMGGGKTNQEFGIKIYTLLYMKQIANKDLLYGTGNYTQYFVITYNGRENKKLYILYIQLQVYNLITLLYT